MFRLCAPGSAQERELGRVRVIEVDPAATDCVRIGKIGETMGTVAIA